MYTEEYCPRKNSARNGIAKENSVQQKNISMGKAYCMLHYMAVEHVCYAKKIETVTYSHNVIQNRVLQWQSMSKR